MATRVWEHAGLGYLAANDDKADWLIKLTVLDSGYDYSLKSEKEKLIAQSLVNTWKQAALPVEADGDEFVGILQSAAFFGSSGLAHSDLTDANTRAQKKQYETVFPLIKSMASDANLRFLDFTNVYDECKYCYIDFCHVSYNAHEVLVDRMVTALSP